MKKTQNDEHLNNILRDGSALGAAFVVGNLLDNLRDTYFSTRRDYVETIDTMRKLNDKLKKSITVDIAVEIKK